MIVKIIIDAFKRQIEYNLVEKKYFDISFQFARVSLAEIKMDLNTGLVK